MSSNSLNRTIEFIKKYRWNSIFVTQLKRALLIILIPFLLVGTLFIYYQNKISLTNTQNLLQESFNSSCNVIKNTFKNLDNQKQIMLIDPNIKILLTLDDISENTENVNRVIQTTKRTLSNAQLSINNIHSISLYSINTKTVFSTGVGGYIENIKEPVWYSEFLKSKNSDFILKYKNESTNSDHLVICGGYYVNSKLYGLIVFDFNIKDFISSAFDFNHPTYSKIILSDKNGLIYYNFPHDKEIKASVLDFLQSDKTFIKNENNFLFKTDFDEIDISISVINNLDALTSGSYSIIFYFALIIFMLLIMTLILSMYLSFQFYDTITKIMEKINEFNSDSIKPQYENELTYITQNISSFFFKTQEIEEQLALNFCELKKAQNLAFQTQFNPHFIFNVLNLINIKVVKYAKDGNNEASRMISLLSVLLRSAINPNEYMVSIKEELDYAKKYIEIESICHNNNFDVFMEIDDSLNSCFTAKFILQPIIENAFQHGIKLLDKERGFVKIVSSKKEDIVIFKVINNTPVLSEEKIQKAISSLNSGNEASGTHIGLYNVNQRIKMLFGEKYGCEFDSTNGITTVTIKLPVIKSKDL